MIRATVNQNGNTEVCGIVYDVIGRKFSTGATPAGIRENAGKPRISIVLEARHAIAGVAGVLTQGSEKYSRANWRKGLMHTEVCDSLSRHLLAYLAGEDADPETGLLHVDHVLANALFLAELTRTRPDLDDRPKLDFDHTPSAGYPFPLADKED